MVGKLGKDSFGEETIKNFEENNVGSKFVIQTEEAPSGTATIIVDSKGTQRHYIS
jgi:ribokinase